MNYRLRWGLKTAVLLLGLCSLSRGQASPDSALTPQEIADRFAGITDNLNTLNSDVAILKWLKVSGYLQARFEANDTSKAGDSLVKNVPTNRNANNLYIRRGRIKFTFQAAPTSKFVIYFDASKNSISMKEAYADLTQMYKRHTFTLTAGQFNVPFGYEVEYSSSKRDFPERSLAENKLFPGERDRGLNLTYLAPKYLAMNLALLQGNGIDGPWNSPLIAKDLLFRTRARLGSVDFGLSGYWGKSFVASVPAVSGSSSWYDANGNNQIDAGEVTTTAPKAAVPGSSWYKDRYGLDAQAYLDLLSVGATGIRGECYFARDYNKDIKCVAKERGWYLWLTQNLGTKFNVAARYDYWSPNIQTADNAVGTWSWAVNYFYDGNVRLTAAYDLPQSLKGKSAFTRLPTDRKDDRFTLQFQFSI